MQELAQLLSRDVEGLIASPDSLKLLKWASRLLLNGGQPRTCANSIRKYYEQLKKIDMSTIERTCKPNWKGLRFIWGDHYSDTTITDEQAIKLLKNKGLSESDFKVLPKGYKDETPETWEEVKKEIKKPVKRQPKKAK